MLSVLASLGCAAPAEKTAGGPQLVVEPAVFTPNGDGVNDSAAIAVLASDRTRVVLEVRDKSGRTLVTLGKHVVPEDSQLTVRWSGRAFVERLHAGTYTVVATFDDGTKITAPVTIATARKLPPMKYSAKPFFPIGAWFEGSPAAAGYPSDPAGARAYYDRCFADLAAHRFNTVAVPNCPETLWETLLSSAQQHKIKVILEAGPLVALVSSPKMPSEAEAYKTVKRVVDKIGKYESLIRYQIRDEPPSEFVSNWVMVQRMLAALDPKRPAFSCFCSSAAMELLTQKTKLNEAVFDIYPHFVATPPQTVAGFPRALDMYTAAARGTTRWAVLQAFAKPGAWRYPSAEELRAVTYLSLASGVKGVFYFIYQTMPEHPEKLEGWIDPQGKPLPMYGPVTELAGELGKLAPLLLALKEGTPAESMDANAYVGSFVDPKGKPVLIVASISPGEAVTVRVKPAGDTTRWKDALTGEAVAAKDGVVEVKLAPGGGKVLVGE